MQSQYLIPAKTVAQQLCVTEGTLAKWRINGTGPGFIRVNRRIAYDPAEISHWLDARRANSTSEAR